MPRTRERPDLPAPVDFIDLTQDSPIVPCTRSSARISNLDNNGSASDLIVIVENDNESDKPKCRRNLNKHPTVINIDDSVNDIDSSNKSSNLETSNSSSNRKSGLTCPICFDIVDNDKTKAMTTPCGHVFCEECLKAICQTRKKCSICQRLITFSNCIRLHI